MKHFGQSSKKPVIGYIDPKDKPDSRDDQILTERDQKLKADRAARKQKRLDARQPPCF